MPTHAQDSDQLLTKPLGEIELNEQIAPEVDVPQADPEAERKINAIDEQRSEKKRDLTAISQAITLSSGRQQELQTEIDEIQKEQGVLVAELIDTAESIQKAERELTAIERRVESLLRSEEDVKLSLRARRAVLVEVLAALQRMGRNPPPTWVVAPQDALKSIRSAVLVGAVVPEIRGETEALLQDLQNLNVIKISLTEEYENFAYQQATLKEEQVRIDLLVKEKKKVVVQSDARLRQEQKQANVLAKKANSLRELVSGMETEIDAIAKTSSKARLSAALAAKRQADDFKTQIEAERSAIASLKPTEQSAVNEENWNPQKSDPVEKPIKIAPRPTQNFNLSAADQANIEELLNAPFSGLKGVLSQPASGVLIGQYGQRDKLGRVSNGQILATRNGAQVIAPATALVKFAGDFRTYGQLVILDVGEKYHILIAGMEEINVKLGDIIKKGEPIARMGKGAKPGGTKAIIPVAWQNGTGTDQPMLYVELRKNNESIDPTSWWAKS